MDTVNDSSSQMTRRDFVKTSSALAVMTSLGGAMVDGTQVAQAQTSESGNGPKVQTVLGPISPDDLGVTLMHEHAPVIDWSELYGHPVAPIEGAFRAQVVDQAVSGLRRAGRQSSTVSRNADRGNPGSRVSAIPDWRQPFSIRPTASSSRPLRPMTTSRVHRTSPSRQSRS